MLTNCYFKPDDKTNLSVESTFIVWIPIDIMLHNHKIRCRSIQWCWIAPFTTKIITGTMVDIVIWVNYESCCLFPNIPWSIADSSTKHLTTFVNAYIIWPHIWCWIYCIQEIQDICWRFSFVKQCPSMHCTTWSTECFHKIKMRRYKIVIFPTLWTCILIIRQWHGFPQPVRVTGMGTGGYGCG